MKRHHCSHSPLFRGLMLALLLIPCCLPGRLISARAAEVKPPNILFIICDDLNTHVKPSGYEHTLTPTLESLAADSMTFRRAYCQYPVCGPSRASLLSGLYPESTGVVDNTKDIRQTRPGTETLPQRLKDSGYWTASVGKVFHSTRHEHGETAWNEYTRFDNDELPVVAAARGDFERENGAVDKGGNRARWKKLSKQVAAPLNAQTPPGHGRSGLKDHQHKDGKNVRQVVRWLREKPNKDQPFFIALGIQKPHVPFLAPDKYFDLYPKSRLQYSPDRPDLWDSIPRDAISGRYQAFGFELGVENDALRREYMQAYHACISFVDAQIAMVLDELKQQGQWENTVVVFTSDHGYHLGDHFLWGKVTLFDIGARVPLIIRVPGMTQPGSQSEAPVELVDLYPTLTDLARLETLPSLQGESLVPQLRDPGQSRVKRHAYSVVSRKGDLGRAIRDERWRYARWPKGEELYDLRKDPTERHNLAKDPSHAQQLAVMRKTLSQSETKAKGQRNQTP